MKKALLSFVVLVVLLGGFFYSSEAEAKAIRVKSYYKPSTGRYINSYYKTSPNKTKLDNYSTKYNYNPYTGKKGSVNPYKW